MCLNNRKNDTEQRVPPSACIRLSFVSNSEFNKTFLLLRNQITARYCRRLISHVAGTAKKTFWGGSSSGWMTPPLLEMVTTGRISSSEVAEGLDYMQNSFLQPYFSILSSPPNNLVLSECVDWDHNTSQRARKENHCKSEMLIKRHSDEPTHTQLTCVCVCLRARYSPDVNTEE